MKRKIYILLRYLLLLAGILGPIYLVHQIILAGRTVFLRGETVGGFAVDSQDRIWVRTTEGVTMIDKAQTKFYELNGQYLSWPNDFKVIQIDKNDHVWVIASTGVQNDAHGVYSFDGSDWILQKSDLPSNKPETNTSIRLLDYEAFLIIGPTDYSHDGNIVSDKQGNIWAAGIGSGLVRFSPDFRPPPYPLGYLHIFFSTGGYWFLGLILTGLYGAKLLGVVREVNIGIGLGLGILVLFSGLFEYALIVFDGYYINPGVFSTIGGIVGGLISKKVTHVKGKKKGNEVPPAISTTTIRGIFIGSVIGICLLFPALLSQ